jgi:hypothetical protein
MSVLYNRKAIRVHTKSVKTKIYKRSFRLTSKVEFEMNQTTPNRNIWTKFGVDLQFQMLKHKKLGSVTSTGREGETVSE